MINHELKYGLFGLRKMEFTFNLAALRSATVAVRMDLGEFLTSEKLTDTDRLFYESYGAWLKGKSPDSKSLVKYAKRWNRLRTKDVDKIRYFKQQSEILSKHFMSALKETAKKKSNEKKNP